MKSILIAALLLGAVPKTLESQTLELDRDRLERYEDPSESLANQLLAMSVVAVRRQDLTEVHGASLPPTHWKQLRFRISPDHARVVKWIERHEWNLDTEPITMPASELLSSLEAFLGHFQSIDDVRFKVKNAEFELKEPVTGRAKIFFFLVGRNHCAASGGDRSHRPQCRHRAGGVPGYLEAKGITYPNFVVAEDDFPKIFKVDALTVPLTALLDEAGLVVEAYSGWSTDTRAKIDALAQR